MGPSPSRPPAPRPRPPRRPRQSLRTGAPAPAAAPRSASLKMAERAGAGTSLRGLRERMGERAGGSRGGSGPRGRRGSRGPGDCRSGAARAGKLHSGVASRAVGCSPHPRRSALGRDGAPRGDAGGRGDGRPAPPTAQVPRPNCHRQRPYPRGRAGRERTNGRCWGGRAGAWHPVARGRSRAPPAVGERRTPSQPSERPRRCPGGAGAGTALAARGSPGIFPLPGALALSSSPTVATPVSPASSWSRSG